MTTPESYLTQKILLPELSLNFCKRVKRKLNLFVTKERRGEVCPKCANLSMTGYDTRKARVRDESIHGLEVFLHITKLRYYCNVCKKPFTAPVPGILPKRRSTQRFRKAVLYACENYVSLSNVCKYMKCSSSLIYKALYEQLELRRRTRIYPWPAVIGIDEISFRRNKKFGHTEYATVVVDIKNRRVIEIILGKDKKTLLKELAWIEGRERVKCVVMDMCDPYRNFVHEFFPNAQIVADKFHALRQATPHILRVLKEEIPVWSNRKQMRRYLLKRPQDLDYFERSSLYKFLDNHPKLKALYGAKEKLFSLYEIRNSNQAPAAYERILKEFNTSMFDELKRFGRTFKRWEKEMLSYFRFRYTNGITEGFNNKLKLVKRMAYGYRSFNNFRLRALNACGA